MEFIGAGAQNYKGEGHIELSLFIYFPIKMVTWNVSSFWRIQFDNYNSVDEDTLSYFVDFLNS